MRRTLAVLLTVGTLALPTSGTWSIVLIDTRTGEIALGSATCLTGFDLQANTPIIIRGVGGATAQSFVDQTSQNRTFIRDHLALGTHPDTILQLLAGFDTGHQTRQYGIADALGRAATFSGSGAFQWAGGKVGKDGDLVYAVQGNILTGAPVVDAAVEAILTTPGDLAEKMMASMEAARKFGGDGRCSCSPSNPTGCGAPPPSFAKSSHIAYMLISRAGDADGSLGAYRAGNAPRDVLVHDVDGDGLPDLLVPNQGSHNVSYLRNVTPPGSEFPMFATPVNFPTGNGPQRAVLGDVTGDGLADLITANSGAGTVSVLPGLAGGGFGPKIDFGTSTNPVGIVAGEFNGLPGLDLATAHGSGGVVAVLRNNGSGGFFPPTTYPTGAGAMALAAGDFDGDGDTDLFVANSVAHTVRFLYNDGLSNFTPAAAIAVPNAPSSVAMGDLDGDGDDDLVVACVDGQSLVLLVREAGGFTQVNHALGKRPMDVAIGDLDGDGDVDLLVCTQTQEFLVLDRHAGAFSLKSSHPVLGVGFQIAAADLDGDGDLDAASPSSTNSVLVAHNHGTGGFHRGLGLASGDYYMSFNVAFTQAGDPDPVFTLAGMFADWAAALSGRPDAVLSHAIASPGVLVADGKDATTLTITLADREGLPVTHPIVSVEVAAVSGPGVSIGPAMARPDGSFECKVTAGTAPGVVELRVRVDDGVRPVELMPVTRLTLIPFPDFDGDDDFDIFDIMGFQQAYSTGDMKADVNADGVVDLKDALAVLDAFAGK